MIEFLNNNHNCLIHSNSIHESIKLGNDEIAKKIIEKLNINSKDVHLQIKVNENVILELASSFKTKPEDIFKHLVNKKLIDNVVYNKKIQ